MLKVAGIWLPEDEEYLRSHLEATPGFADSYDAQLIARACAIGRRRIAVDVGANVGLWSRQLAKHFQSVHAFEPLNDVRKCLAANAPGAILHRAALGDRNGSVAMIPKVTGSGMSTTLKTRVIMHETAGGIPMRTLDSFMLADVDFIKIDCEGFDYCVMVGAEMTIMKWRPAIVFESKPGVSAKRYGVPQDAAREWLEARGYAVKYEERGNFFMEAGE